MTRFENSVLPWFGLPRSLPTLIVPRRYPDALSPTIASTASPWRCTNAGPIPLTSASSASELGRSDAIVSSVLLWATV